MCVRNKEASESAAEIESEGRKLKLRRRESSSNKLKKKKIRFGRLWKKAVDQTKKFVFVFHFPASFLIPFSSHKHKVFVSVEERFSSSLRSLTEVWRENEKASSSSSFFLLFSFPKRRTNEKKIDQKKEENWIHVAFSKIRLCHTFHFLFPSWWHKKKVNNLMYLKSFCNPSWSFFFVRESYKVQQVNLIVTFLTSFQNKSWALLIHF